MTLGIGILQGNGPGATQLAISQAVGSKGWIVPEYSLKQLHAHYRNAIGYSLPDEPDGNGLLPATADPDGGKRLPYTERARKTGVLIMQTLTAHFMRSMPVGRHRRRGVPRVHGQCRPRADGGLPVRRSCADPSSRVDGLTRWSS